MGSFHFTDNLVRSLTFTGQMCVDAWPKLITSRKTVRILGEDGEPQTAIIDPNLVDAMGKPIPYAEVPNEKGGVDKVYNLNCGKYDVVVVAGPSYTTRRLESADAMMEISRGNPEFLGKFGDIIFKAQDWPGAEQVAERFKKMLPPELQEQDDQNEKATLAKQTQQVQEAVKMIGQREAELQAQEQAIAQAAQETEAQAKAAQAIEQRAKDAKRAAEAEVEKLNAAMDALENERKIFDLQRKIADQETKMQLAELESEKEVARAEVKALQAQMSAVTERAEAKVGEVNAAAAASEKSNAAAEASAQILAQAMEAIAEVKRLSLAPRRSVIEYDVNGEPIASVSVPVTEQAAQ